ncbi:MAG: YbhB/YbcL family Raf kinase inhibitor-like protein [Hyphomicrobiales bacterium]|nr:YbhB/YbcL family Raf kinase inhibitor-like protein [Hyphomicrobiales bacterium]
MKLTTGCLTAGLSLAALATTAHAASFKVTSPDVTNGGTIKAEQVFNNFGCTGNNISPELNWSGAPSAAKSFAVTVYDPDAPTGSGFWHWLIVNVPASVTSLPKNAGDPKADLAPKGSVQARTDYGAPGYGGPCPPKGDKPHRYIFTVFAVDTDKLDITPETSGAVVGFNLHFHTLAKATLTARYGR